MTNRIEPVKGKKAIIKSQMDLLVPGPDLSLLTPQQGKQQALRVQAMSAMQRIAEKYFMGEILIRTRPSFPTSNHYARWYKADLDLSNAQASDCVITYNLINSHPELRDHLGSLSSTALREMAKHPEGIGRVLEHLESEYTGPVSVSQIKIMLTHEMTQEMAIELLDSVQDMLNDIGKALAEAVPKWEDIETYCGRHRDKDVAEGKDGYLVTEMIYGTLVITVFRLTETGVYTKWYELLVNECWKDSHADGMRATGDIMYHILRIHISLKAGTKMPIIIVEADDNTDTNGEHRKNRGQQLTTLWEDYPEMATVQRCCNVLIRALS